MDENQKREFAREWILNGVRDVEFLDITETLFDESIDDPYNNIAREIMDLIDSANVEVTWNE